MTSKKILLIEDEQVLAEIVRESLQSRGFLVTHAGTVKSAAEEYYKDTPDIIVLDVMLTDGDGFTFARQVRNIDMQVPIIFLTSRSQARDVVEGFESGGNDYLKKPFSIEELIVRIKALLSRNGLLIQTDTAPGTVQLGQYKFEYPGGVLNYFDERRALTTREAEILQMLLINKNRAVDRKTILLNFWGNDDYFSGRSLDVFITKLRRYLKNDPSVSILNIRGQGYKLIY
ncbi:MAG TPA: response regulator transcription factor [Mucilaginibacter sp.]|nr:response regulator transcription factor [Mucilaginibacter sp.]